jgi:hypothetical protein
VAILAFGDGGVVGVCTRFREADQCLDVGEIECGMNESRSDEREEQCEEGCAELHDARVTLESR